MNDKDLTVVDDNSTVWRGPRCRGSRITVEMALWGVVGILALVLRLVNLGTDAAPLAAHEAREAMLAWRAVTGQGMPSTGYSPFLFTANSVLFALCGANDTLARIWPALLGSAFVLTPLFFRQRIGRVGVLAAGLYLAISPTALFASRQLDGAVLVALGGAMFVGGGLRFLETGETGTRRWLVLSAAGLALAVTSAPSAYGMLLPLGLAGLAFTWGWSPDRLHRLSRCVRLHVGFVFVAFAVTVLLFSTGLGWHLSGLGATVDLFSAWFAGLGKPSLLSLMNLLLYEPLVVIVGLIGLVWFLLEKRRFGLLIGLWFAFGLGLSFAIPPLIPVRAVWVVLPLALLGGFAVEAALRNRYVIGKWRAEWVYAAITSALWIYLYLRFSSYGLKGNALDLIVGVMALISPLFLLALAAGGFALTSRDDRLVTGEIITMAHSVLRGAITSTGAVLLAITFSTGWGVAYIRPADPRELLVYEPTAVEVHDLVQTLRRRSWRETGFPTTLVFAYEAPADSVLAWYLRDFSAARRVDSLPQQGGWEPGWRAVVAADRDWVPELVVDDDDLVNVTGQDFALSRRWDASNVNCFFVWPPCKESIEWLIRRDPTSTHWLALDTEVGRWAVVWLYENTKH
jgi:uncharacterized protein (TIGR03663 family)